ncbi:MAG: ABC transporter permease [Clostridiales bacterium]|nr:ABC transporter permease [Clostridiales bacterium]
MKTFSNLVRRNLKVFFKDKGLFFSSLITPIILLVLYVTFLAKAYLDSFSSNLPSTFQISDELLNGTVAAQLISALLAVSCVTVSFCANLLMIQDKANSTIKDFTVSPVKNSVIAISYYVSSALSTLIVTFSALAVSLVYLSTQGWYMSAKDVILIIVDVFVLTLFGTAFSSFINSFLSTNGQASAVGTIVSAGYGFLCGAYMPISSYSEGLQKVLMFLPGTYGTCLIKRHMMRGIFEEMENIGFPSEVVTNICDGIDFNIYFFDTQITVPAMYLVMGGAVLAFTGLFVLVNVMKKKAK